ncbi:MAG: glycosyl transferase group 1, partial [bacterium]|nr:glycosyl transferase group 1 [bacterium]
MKIALLTEIPAPYRVPIFNALADESDVDVDVIFLRAHDPKRPHYRFDEASARFAWRILPGMHVARGDRWLILNRSVVRALLRTRADAFVVGGWAQPAFWQTLLLAKFLRRPTIAWVESTSRDQRSGARLLELAKRRFVRASDGVLVPGRASVDYVRALGAQQVAVAPNAVDFSLFRSRVDTIGRNAARMRL